MEARIQENTQERIEDVALRPGCWKRSQEGLSHVCLILDLDAYRISGKPFIVRELGWCNMQGKANSIHFTHEMRYADLDKKDRRTVGYVFSQIHALPFEAAVEEKAIPQKLVDSVVRTLY